MMGPTSSGSPCIIPQVTSQGRCLYTSTTILPRNVALARSCYRHKTEDTLPPNIELRFLSSEMSQHCSAEGNQVPRTRILDESHKSDSSRWTCFPVEQDPLGHQGYLCLLPRYERRAAAGRERATNRMGPAGCHFPCIISKVIAQRKIFFTICRNTSSTIFLRNVV